MKKHIFLAFILFASCTANKTTNQPEENMPEFTAKLLMLDPGHFHANLVQKSMYADIDPQVHVYAPEGPEVDGYLASITNFNSRTENPTSWQEEIYKGSDYLDKMIQEKAGNVVVISGNNKRKTEYIQKSINAGLNVLADKPMVIDSKDFESLIQSFQAAEAKNVLLYDIMTERYEITNIIQKKLSKLPALFGELEKGSPENPAIVIESTHHFFKYVSGNVLKRPPWFFDVAQQGEPMVDVGTHLIDLVQWACFPEQALDYQTDIDVYAAKHWPTLLSEAQFNRVTQLSAFPDFLKKDVDQNGMLNVLANGECSYTLKGIHIKVAAKWAYEAPEGGADTHYATMRGSKANLIIRQGKDQEFKPLLYVENVSDESEENFENALAETLASMSENYPDLSYKKVGTDWEIIIPDHYKIGHEAHFSQVMEKYISYLKTGKLPDWEVSNMIAKYYTTTQAFKLANESF